MGQKVNPIAVRRESFNRFSDSSWFSDYYYSILLYQDLNFRQYLSSLRQPNANKLGFRPAKSIIHHFPKRSLIHLFCLSDPRERDGSGDSRLAWRPFIGGFSGALRRPLLSSTEPSGGKIMSPTVTSGKREATRIRSAGGGDFRLRLGRLASPALLLRRPFAPQAAPAGALFACGPPPAGSSDRQIMKSHLVKAGPGGRILVEPQTPATWRINPLTRALPASLTTAGSVAPTDSKDAASHLGSLKGAQGPSGHTGISPARLLSSQGCNPGQESFHPASHDHLEVSTSWFNSSTMQKKKALINLHRLTVLNLTQLFLNIERQKLGVSAKEPRIPVRPYGVLREAHQTRLGAPTESRRCKSLPGSKDLRILAMTRSVVDYYFNFFAMEYYFMRNTNNFYEKARWGLSGLLRSTRWSPTVEEFARFASPAPTGSYGRREASRLGSGDATKGADGHPPASLAVLSGLLSGSVQLASEVFIRSGQITRSLDFYLSNVKSILSQNTNTFISLRPLKARSIFQCASLVAQEIACKLEQKKSFRLICRLIFQQLADCKNIKGIRVTCSGRLNGAEIAKTECRKFGETSLHVFSDKIDYARTEASTPFGILGVKVWISYI